MGDVIDRRFVINSAGHRAEHLIPDHGLKYKVTKSRPVPSVGVCLAVIILLVHVGEVDLCAYLDIPLQFVTAQEH
jgi:hypothetical protein